MEPVIPYLTFNGNTAEALAFYAKALGGRVVFQQTFGESPMDVAADQKSRIMHARFEAGDLSLMASDAMPDQKATPGSNVSLLALFIKSC